MERKEDWIGSQEICLIQGLSLPGKIENLASSFALLGPDIFICKLRVLLRSSLYWPGSLRFAKLYYVLADLGQLTFIGSALLGEVYGFSSESWYRC